MKTHALVSTLLLLSLSGCTSGGGPGGVGGSPNNTLDLGQPLVDAAAPIDLKSKMDLSVPFDLTTKVDLAKPAADLATPICSTLSLTGAPPVWLATTVGAPPIATGGGLTDGVYFLTSATGYATHAFDMGPAAPGAIHQALRIAGSSFEVITDVFGLETVTASGSFSATGTQIKFTYTCPHDDEWSTAYSSTAGQLALIVTTSSIDVPTAVDILTKQ